jgi:hypothetical protein
MRLALSELSAESSVRMERQRGSVRVEILTGGAAGSRGASVALAAAAFEALGGFLRALLGALIVMG